MVYRRTLRREVACTGIGLHSGRPVRLRLRPAPAEHGIRFVRTDVGVEIPASLAHIGAQDHATTLQKDGVSIGTVEHLLAALLGLGVDDALVEVDGPEVPVLDGSAAPFVILLHEAGLRPLAAPRLHLKVLPPGRGGARDEDGAARARRATSRSATRSDSTTRCFATRRSRSGSRLARSPTTSPRRGPSASCARWSCCARTASASAAASRTRWSSARRASSTTSSASRTSSSGTRCSTRWGTSLSSATRSSAGSRPRRPVTRCTPRSRGSSSRPPTPGSSCPPAPARSSRRRPRRSSRRGRRARAADRRGVRPARRGPRALVPRARAAPSYGFAAGGGSTVAWTAISRSGVFASFERTRTFRSKRPR